MEDKNKIITYAVITLVVGLLIGTAAGYAIFHNEKTTTDDTYYFYLYFGDNSADNDWYSGTGSNAGNAFENAMDKAGYEWETDNYGYIGSINDVGDTSGWALYQYVYSEYTSAAAQNSILYPINDSYGYFASSNGWKAITGYDDSAIDFKLTEMSSFAYFFSVYPSDWDPITPVETTVWMSDGPFA
jgi:hypothetical protein